MKLSLTLALLFFSSSIGAINVEQVNVVQRQNSKKTLIEIDVSKKPYQNQLSQAAANQTLSDKFYMDLNEALNIPMQKGGNFTLHNLHQQGLTKPKQPAGSDLVNLKNMGYEGEFYFGNPTQKMQVIFDTGSPAAWVYSEKCKANNCPLQNKKYQQSKSTEFHNNDKAGQVIQYGRGTVLGNPSTDRLCFTQGEDHCVHNISFLTVVKAADLSALKGSGLVGLAPSPAEKKNLDDPFHTGVPGFVAQLKANKDFNKDFEPMFSIYLSNDETVPGKMIFGGYDLPQFAKQGAKDADIQWADQSKNDQYWTINSKNVQIGDGAALAGNYQQLIIDNGMSFGLIPNKSFIALLKFLKEKHGVNCQNNQPFWSCEVSEQKYMTLPNMKFNIVANPQGKTFDVEMPFHAYMKLDGGAPNQAWLTLSPSDDIGIVGNNKEEYWVLGAQFLQNYYSIFDFKQKRIGFVESKSAMLKIDANTTLH